MTLTLSDAVERVKGPRAREFLVALRDAAEWESRFAIEVCAREQDDGLLVSLRVSSFSPDFLVATLGVLFTEDVLRGDLLGDKTLRFPRRPSALALSAEGDARSSGCGRRSGLGRRSSGLTGPRRRL
ncbi:hypothetical protein [Paractinoplanes atraurantiacus]|uniref:hypothetical protein n=1 Tax=Paractinoplanes atraurantiacus TaxID=1036182 RepID=UPI0011785977|nr:hypothetical protein [Actinoplanes atraurantiacus]